MVITMKPQQSDIKTALFIFSFYKGSGYTPSQQEVADHFKFSRQAAFNRFQRLVYFGVLKQLNRGLYEVSARTEMPLAFAGLYHAAPKK